MRFDLLLKSNKLRTLSCALHRFKNIKNGETPFIHKDLTDFTIVQDYFLIRITFASALSNKGLNVSKRLYSLYLFCQRQDNGLTGVA